MSTMIIIMLIVTAVVIVGFILGVRASYKIRPVKSANNYLKRDTVKFRQKSDTYIRTRVTKVKINTK